jgi:hypothetical protein
MRNQSETIKSEVQYPVKQGVGEEENTHTIIQSIALISPLHLISIIDPGDEIISKIVPHIEKLGVTRL